MLPDWLKIRLLRPERHRRRKTAAVCGVDSLERRILLTAPSMTDSEQYMLELINRARANPAAEAARYGIGLNDGVAPEDTITTDPKQPLAAQQQLITAAVLHSQDMLDRDYFNHTTLGAGTTFDQRVTNQGYIWNRVAENIGYAARQVSLSETAYIDTVHEGLIRSSGHRENIMLPTLEEVGIGARLGSFKPPNNPATFQYTEMVTQDFGSRNLNPYITGVVYTDANNDDFYTIGESIRSGTVTAVNVASGAEFTDTIGVSGAYGFVVPAGTYTVTATVFLNGANRTYRNPASVVVGTNNVKIDFETNSGTLVTNQLTLQSTVSTLNESGTATSTLFTVTRNGSTATTLTINLISSDASEVTVPATVEILAGSSSATFTALAVNDGVIDGNQTATITASAAGWPSVIRTLTVIDRTYPSLPAGIQTVATARPTFTWTSVSNAVSYEIWIDNTTTGETRVVNSAGITANSYTTAVDLPIGTFNVWVRGFAAGKTGVWSPVSVWKLRPTTTVLGAGRTEAKSNFNLTWTSVPGASSYDVWIDRLTSSTSQYLRNTNVTGNSLAVSNFDIGSYKVWVRARNSAGDLTGWSTGAVINVDYASGRISVDAGRLSATATLTWPAVAGAQWYDVWVNNLTTGTSAAIRDVWVSGTSLELNAAAPASWRAWVRARDLNGGVYVWSNPFDFEIGRAPRVTLPTGNGQPVKPVFAWTTVAGATRYEIWVTDLNSSLRVISVTNLTTTSYTSTLSLTSGISYRVWIKAFDSAGTASAWSQPLTFTIALRSSPSPNLRWLPHVGDEPVLDQVFASAELWLNESLSCTQATTDENAKAVEDAGTTRDEMPLSKGTFVERLEFCQNLKLRRSVVPEPAEMQFASYWIPARAEMTRQKSKD